MVLLLFFLVDITKKQDGHFDAPPHLFMKVSSVARTIFAEFRTFSPVVCKPDLKLYLHPGPAQVFLLLFSNLTSLIQAELVEQIFQSVALALWSYVLFQAHELFKTSRIIFVSAVVSGILLGKRG